MNKINFTKENLAEMKDKFLDLSFSGIVLQGKLGSNQVTPYDLLHNTSISTLSSLRTQLKNEITKFEENTDEWTTTPYFRSQNEQKKTWERYLYLLIGYKKKQEQDKAKADKLQSLKDELSSLKNDSMSPAEKAKAKQEEIDALLAED
jgi:hypothetical protein